MNRLYSIVDITEKKLMNWKLNRKKEIKMHHKQIDKKT